MNRRGFLRALALAPAAAALPTIAGRAAAHAPLMASGGPLTGPIRAGRITAAQLNVGSVTAGKLRANSILAPKIAPGFVRASDEFYRELERGAGAVHHDKIHPRPITVDLDRGAVEFR